MSAGRRIFIGITFLFSMSAANVLANMYPEFTYSTETRDGQFVFVMLSPYPWMDDMARGYAEGGSITYSQFDMMKALKAKYPRSGLYRNDGSTTPLWTVNGYLTDAAVSSDGVHLCSLEHWPVEGLFNEILTFYENGEEIRRYSAGDLVKSTEELPSSGMGYCWLDGFIFNDENNTLVIALMNKDRFTFDIRSGEIIRIERNPKKIYIGLLVGAALLLLVVGGLIIVKRF